MPIDISLLRPGNDGHAGEVRTIVADDAVGFAAPGKDRVEFPRHADTGQRRVSDQARTLAGEMIDDAQDTQQPTVDQRIGNKVQ